MPMARSSIMFPPSGRMIIAGRLLGCIKLQETISIWKKSIRIMITMQHRLMYTAGMTCGVVYSVSWVKFQKKSH